MFAQLSKHLLCLGLLLSLAPCLGCSQRPDEVADRDDPQISLDAERSPGDQGLRPSGTAVHRGAPSRGAEFGPLPIRYDRQWALIVGIDYQDSPDLAVVKPLNNAGRDAEEVYKVLTEDYGFEAEETAFLMTEQAGREHPSREPTRDKVLDKLEKIAEQAGPNDCILFFFAGHGDNFEGIRGRLYPRDVSVRRGGVRHASCISLVDIIDELSDTKCRARHRMIVLDSCDSGRLFQELARTRSAAGTGIEQIFANRALVGLSSSGAGQKASDGDQSGHSPFTKALLRVLHEAEPGRPLAAEHVAHQVRRKVVDQVPVGGQHPVYGTRSADPPGDFFFLPSPSKSGPSAPSETHDRLALQTLPGLTGDWWFEESPWFIPHARADLPAPRHETFRVPGVHSALPSDPRHPSPASFYGHLRRRIERHFVDKPSVLQAERWFRELSRETLQAEDKSRLLDDLLAAASSQQSALDLHMIAVLQHALGLPAAEASYREMLQAYANASEDQDVTGLRALGLADFARYLYGAGRSIDAVAYCQRARRTVDEEVTPQFLIDSFCLEAMAQRKLSNWERVNDLMDRVQVLVDGELAVLPDGEVLPPLIGYAYERRAWALMDQWRLVEAKDAFQEAATIFRALWEQDIGHGGRNPVDKARLLHAEHGLAMIARFRGERAADGRRAEQLYRAVCESVDRQLQDWPHNDPLLVRAVNSRERLADVYLMSAHLSREQVFAARRNLRAARNAERQRRELLGAGGAAQIDPTPLVRLLYKGAIAEGLLDRPSEAEQLRQRAENLLASSTESQDLLAAAARVTSIRDAEAFDDLLQVLRQKLASRKALSREQLDLILFAAALPLQPLFEDSVEQQHRDQAQDTLRQALRRFDLLGPERHQVRLYTRPYFDVLIEQQVQAWLAQGDRGHVYQLLDLVCRARSPLIRFEQHEQHPSLVFHIYAHQQGGVVIFQPSPVLWRREDLTGAQQLHVEPFGPPFVAEVLQKSSRQDDPLPWPEGLEHILQVVEDLSVQVAWPDPQLGLDETNFPFARPGKPVFLNEWAAR